MALSFTTSLHGLQCVVSSINSLNPKVKSNQSNVLGIIKRTRFIMNHLEFWYNMWRDDKNKGPYVCRSCHVSWSSEGYPLCPVSSGVRSKSSGSPLTANTYIDIGRIPDTFFGRPSTVHRVRSSGPIPWLVLNPGFDGSSLWNLYHL